ncbi:MAG: hypothetical protein K2O47_07470, partial [Muribaculaceae bacterium]|nr:hypothetical protein [Muribaculaceae bacterium]
LKNLASEFAGAKVMLVAGFCAPDHNLDKGVRMISSYPNVVVMAETVANLHDPQPMSTMIDSVLCDMSEEDKKRLRPDIVISLGGALVSRMLKQYLRDYPPRRQWSLGHSNYFCDCFKSLTDKIDIGSDSFLRQLCGGVRKLRTEINSDYSSSWRELRERSALSAKEYIRNAGWSDLKALDYIFSTFKFDNIFLSNGTVVRYSQLLPHSCHAEYCNRGVSGIDGCTSTAVGGAWEYSGQTCLISGDMSWLYDSGASALDYLPYDMRMIVVDNSGGGIFRFIKSTSRIPEKILSRYFCIEDLPDIADIAAAYSIDVMVVENMKSLEKGVEWLSEDSVFPRMLIVRTPPEESAGILSGYFSKATKTS